MSELKETDLFPAILVKPKRSWTLKRPLSKEKQRALRVAQEARRSKARERRTKFRKSISLQSVVDPPEKKFTLKQILEEGPYASRSEESASDTTSPIPSPPPLVRQQGYWNKEGDLYTIVPGDF